LLSFRSIFVVIPQHLCRHSAASLSSFRSIFVVIPQHLCCHSAASLLSFRSEAEESAFIHCTTVYTIA
jgi:hypothetical protein